MIGGRGDGNVSAWLGVGVGILGLWGKGRAGQGQEQDHRTDPG